MNIGIVFYFLGWVLGIEGILMILPCVVALVYREPSGFYFLGVALFCGISGWLLAHRKLKSTVFYAKEGFVAVSLSWIVLSFFGALPFFLSGEIPLLEDALFEVISGFTTTGASVLPDVEALSRCMLMWRSFTHWIGGMGVLVFILAVLPLAGGYNIHIMRAESPGPSVGKLVPRVRTTAKILYLIYLFITVVQIILLLFTGMPLFDSMAMSFGTAGTGGFGIVNSSCGDYTSLQQWIFTIFMILFGVNFNVYYLFLIRKPKDALRCEEMRGYLGIILVSTLLITWNIRGMFPDILTALKHAAFQVGSIITTTGYSSTDFDLWPGFSRTILVCLMFIGACAGSTGGGIKVSRFVILLKMIRREISHIVHPRSVNLIKLDGYKVDEDSIRSVTGFIILYVLILLGSFMLVSLDNFDFITNVTAVTTCLSNVGPGLAMAGPVENLSFFSGFAKIVLCLDMLLGRLEIFPIIMLFAPSIWRKSYM